MAIKCIFGYRYLRDIETGEEFSEYNTLLENLKNYYLITLKDEKFSNIKTRLLSTNNNVIINRTYFNVNDTTLTLSYTKTDSGTEDTIDSLIKTQKVPELLDKKEQILKEFQNYYNAYYFITQKALTINKGSPSYSYIGIALFNSNDNIDLSLSVDKFTLTAEQLSNLKKLISYLHTEEKPNLYLIYCNNS